MATATRYKRDPETRQATDEIEGYAVNVLSAKGEPQTVKLPIDSAPVVNQIHDALNEDKLVRVSFGGRLYAVLQNILSNMNRDIASKASLLLNTFGYEYMRVYYPYLYNGMQIINLKDTGFYVELEVAV